MIAFISAVPEETKGEDLTILARLVADNRLTPQIGWTADWTQTADAFAAMAQRAFPGKAVLTIPHHTPDLASLQAASADRRRRKPSREVLTQLSREAAIEPSSSRSSAAIRCRCQK